MYLMSAAETGLTVCKRPVNQSGVARFGLSIGPSSWKNGVLVKGDVGKQVLVDALKCLPRLGMAVYQISKWGPVRRQVELVELELERRQLKV